MSKPDVPFVPPRSLFGYRVVSELGQGSDCRIYRGADAAGKVVALKHLKLLTKASGDYIAQAECEAAVSQRIDHPAVRKVTQVFRTRRWVHGIGELMRWKSPKVTAEVCLVMEMVDGGTLTNLPDFDMVRLCALLLDLADGVGAIHKAGLVHSEIKPSNILFTKSGKAKIIDLGLACEPGTARNFIHHTPGFIAPEQSAHKKVTFQTDIFSFGATAYRVLTGKVPGIEMREGKQKEVDKYPSPRELNPNIPPALSALVVECLKKTPDQRPRDISDVRDRLSMAIKQVDHKPAHR